MKNLVIVESPSKSKTIEKYLGSDYKVLSSKGHIRDLSLKGKDRLGVDIANDFEPDYTILEGKEDVIEQLKKEAKKADNVYLATDPDREGEAISWHLAEVLGLDINDKDRIVFNEITKSAVTQALKEPRAIDMDLVHSQETRRILDRVIGFKLSKLLQNKIKSKSAGRVQSIALRMICDREIEIRAFVPEEYWTIEASFISGFVASLTKIGSKKAKLSNKEEADAVLARCKGPFLLKSVKSQTKKKQARLPFITSTLQQEASTKLGFNARRTMRIAQALYEGVDIGNGPQGLITYMRTDSTRLSQEFVNGARAFISENYGKDYLGTYRIKNEESSQDAHEAIRPTSLDNDPEKIKSHLSSEQYRLYRFIYYRALASLMADAKTKATSYTLEINDLTFQSNGSVLTFDGYLKVYSDYESSKDNILPELEEGTSLEAKEVKAEQHFTEAPSRYTEARLIKALEEEGIGRPSTYATIIDTIINRGYVEHKTASESSKTKFFFPTEQGELTDQKLREYFASVINIKYTAEMEKELDDIASGKTSGVSALKSFYEAFEPLLNNAYTNMEKKAPELVGEKCPDCGNDLVYRTSRYGKFISCSNFPKCRYTASIDDGKREEPEEIGRDCPECGSKLLKRKSRYGTYFIGCSSYPKCRYIENIDGQKPKYKRKKK